MSIRRILAAALVLCGLAASAFAADPTQAEIEAGAKQEGHFVWYTGSERDPSQAMLDAFKKKYPFLQVEIVRASSAELANRVEAELTANRLQGDTFEYSLTYLTASLQARGEIMEYQSPEYASYPAEFSKSGYWAATGLSSILVMVNTNKVNAENMPSSWSDLAKPFWRNKLVIDNLEVSGTGYNWLHEMVGPGNPGWDLVEAIGKNRPSLERGHAGMAQKVASGEYPAAIEMSDFHIYALHRRAPTAPIRAVWPKEGVPREAWTGGIFKRAPHPFAARLFQNFMLSKEGQTVYTQEMGRVSARADVALPVFAEMPANVTYLHAPETPPDDVLKVRRDYVAHWKQLWNLK